jgi:hypothetical protein
MYSTGNSCKIAIKLEFLGRFSKTPPNVMKILPVGAEFFHADGQTDTT